MFDHVTVRASDHHASRRFYETVLAPLGHAISLSGGHFHEWNDFGIAQSREDRPVTRRLHVAFVARSRADVEAFWRAGTDGGYASDGEPGLRPQYHADYYGAFLLDPDGNSVEAVYHGRAREGYNVIDHLWIRVGDLDASKRFYETVRLGVFAHACPSALEEFLAIQWQPVEDAREDLLERRVELLDSVE